MLSKRLFFFFFLRGRMSLLQTTGMVHLDSQSKALRAIIRARKRVRTRLVHQHYQQIPRQRLRAIRERVSMPCRLCHHRVHCHLPLLRPRELLCRPPSSFARLARTKVRKAKAMLLAKGNPFRSIAQHLLRTSLLYSAAVTVATTSLQNSVFA